MIETLRASEIGPHAIAPVRRTLDPEGTRINARWEKSRLATITIPPHC
jgi:hypothetical protein